MDFQKRIDDAWDTKAIKIDWLGLETLLRDILSSDLVDSEKVKLSQEAISAFTRRG